MFSKSAVFSSIIALMACSACTSKPSEAPLKSQNPAVAALDTQIEQLRKKRDYCKARIYEAADESMRTEFNANWEDYRGNLSQQEFFEEKLDQLNRELGALQEKRQALQK